MSCRAVWMWLEVAVMGGL
ncbi:hypothetical protein JL09_g6842 [Pichia kudriavzevii]|uniref:Uncharacterized protein n=1 Tax=Pichia kudriavzevii TaxID=4909 RepID=A0A099NKT2_PICKU|nr:hypothetical protein JL09_g6842 [Pichia kudriavzevii]